MAKKNVSKSQKNILIWLIFSLILVLLLIVTITTAYFSNSKNSSGTIQLGEIDFTIFENNVTFQNIVPAQTINKTVSISNSRDEAGRDVRNLGAILFRFTFSAITNDLGEDVGSQNVNNFSLENLASIVTNDDYTFCDGYYYFNGILMPSEQTYLCSGISFSSLIGNEFQDRGISLIFNVEAIQAENEAYIELWPEAPSNWVSIIEHPN